MSKQQWQRTKRERRFKAKEKARKAGRGYTPRRPPQYPTLRLPWWRRMLMRLRREDHYYDPSYGTFGRDGYLR